MPSYARIKQLDWTNAAPPADKTPDYWVCNSIVGQFIVSRGSWTLKQVPTVRPMLETRDDDTAKAAAQALFESLIRAQLEPEIS